MNIILRNACCLGLLLGCLLMIPARSWSQAPSEAISRSLTFDLIDPVRTSDNTIEAISRQLTFDLIASANRNDTTMEVISREVTAAITQAQTPDQLSFITQPSSTTVGKVITPAVTVAVADANGVLVSNAGNTVTLVAQLNGSGTPIPLGTANAVNGIATFDKLTLSGAGTYTLQATADGCGNATSNPFTISASTLRKLVFSTQPTDTVAGQTITPVVLLSIQDALGNLVNTATNVVTLTLGNTPNGGVVRGTLSVAAVGGIAAFSNLNIDKAGAGYTLIASGTGLTSATSKSFNVTWQITPTAGANGTISPNTPQNINAGGSVTFTATANAGYAVDAWQLDGASLQTGGAQCTLTNITANHAVKVSFRSIVSAAVICVSPTGDDANDGYDWAHAKKTIQAGIDLAAANYGGDVWVKGSAVTGCIYNENLTLKPYAYLYGGFKGTEDPTNATNRSLRNWTTYLTIIDGQQRNSVITVQDNLGSYGTIDGFTIRNGGAVNGGGIHCGTSASPTISHNRIINNKLNGSLDAIYGGGIYCGPYSAPLITANQLIGNTASTGGAIYCAVSSAAEIANNLLQDNVADSDDAAIHIQFATVLCHDNSVVHSLGTAAMLIWGSSAGVVVNNTIVGGTGTQPAVRCGGGAVQVVLANNLIAFNPAGIMSEIAISGSVTLHNNDVYHNTAYDYSGVTAGATDKSLDPLFISATGGDYHLQPTSPCINAGSDADVQAGWTDIDGDPRICGAHVDIGCDEYTTPPTPSPISGVICVSLAGNDANDGSSWAKAKLTVQAGITAAARLGGEVWVAQGTYQEHLSLPTSVALYGGFAGTEATRGARDWQAHPVIIDGQNQGIVLGFTQYLTTTVDGFTLQNGMQGLVAGNIGLTLVNLIVKNHGGVGITGTNCRLTFSNVTASGNTGTGITCDTCQCSVTNLMLTGNGGDGLYCTGGSGVYQQLTSSGNTGDGLNWQSTQCSATNLTLTGNTGAGLYTSGCSGSLQQVLVTGNKSKGLWLNGGTLQITRADVEQNGNDGCYMVEGTLTLANALVAHNTNLGVACDAGTVATLTNLTVVDNHGGGIFGYANAVNGAGNTTVTVTNGIVAFNAYGINQGGNGWSGTVTPSYTDVYGNGTQDYLGGVTAGTNSLAVDPQFASASLTDCHLQATSPCIDAGNDAKQVGTQDLEGNPRLQQAHIDLGAYEVSGITLTPVAGTNGTISPDSPQTVPFGSSFTFTATANAGYMVNTWALDDTVVQTSGTQYTLKNITVSHTIKVTFKSLPTYTITPVAGANGAISPSTPQTVLSGGSVKFTAAANTGFTADSWYLDGTVKQTGGTTYTLTNVTANHAVLVTFKVPGPYTITPSAGANGTIAPATPQTVVYGGSVTFTAVANNGYQVDSWYLDTVVAQASGTTYILNNVSANHAVKVTFKLRPSFTVTPSATANGTISPATAQTVFYGDAITFTATANAGYSVDAWYLDGLPAQTGKATFTLSNVTANHALLVTFKPMGPYTIVPSADANGSISPSTPQTVINGGSVTFTAAANAGYTVDRWYLDGVAVQTGGVSYTLVNVTANHGVKVTFLFNSVQGSRGDWWMFHHDPQHTGCSSFVGPKTPTIRWTFAAGGAVESSPAIARDGTICVGSSGGNFYAINPNGTKKWAYLPQEIVSIVSSPAIGVDGSIYVGAGYVYALPGGLYAFNSSGTFQWRTLTGEWLQSSPVIDTNGNIDIGAVSSQLYSVTPNGQQHWTFSARNNIYSSPAIGADGTIYTNSVDGHLYALNPDGSQKWAFDTGHNSSSEEASPSVGADGTIYIGSNNGQLYAVNPDGTRKWAFYYGFSNFSTPAIGADGTIYIGSNNGNLYAIKSDGSPSWTFPTGGGVESSPAIGGDGTIYVGSDDGNLYAVTPAGQKLWSVTTGGKVDSSPAIGADGTIYVGSDDGNLYAIGTPLPVVATPTFTPDGGSYATATNVTITCATAGAAIYYTTNGMTPTTDDTRYTAPVTLTTTATLRARAFATGMTPSAVKSGAYFIANSSEPRGDWWMFHHDPQHTGRSPFTGPTSAVQKWAFATGLYVISSPALGADGTIYFGADDNKFYALNPNGTKKWAFSAGNYFESSPAIAKDGTIYAGCLNGQLFALNADGTQKWSFNTGSSIFSSPVIGTTGTIYFGAENNNIYAVNPDGSRKWVVATGAIILSSPAIGADETIYVGSMDNKLYALNTDGSVKWTYATTGSIEEASPAIARDGTIYVGSFDHSLYAINPDGTKKWAFLTGNEIESSPAIAADGTIYIGASDGTLYAINSAGTQKWTYPTGSKISSSPTIGADGAVYFGTLDGHMYALTANGARSWGFAAGDNIRSVPAIGPDGTLYFGSYDHNLYALTTSAATFTVTPTAGTNGTITPSTTQTVMSGGSATFTAAANAGYTVDSWQLDGSSVQTGGTQYTLRNVTANHAVKVTFKALTFTITPSAGANGAISPATIQTVSYGGSARFTASVNAGYTTDAWYLDGAGVQTGGGSYTVANVTANHNLSVTFKTLVLTITPSAGANGAISPSTPQTVNYGGNITFTATANAGYTVDSWSLDGAVVQTGGAQYAVQNVTASHSVNVTFKLLPALTVFPSAGQNGAISPSTPQLVNYGGSITFTAAANAGYTVDSWYLDGASAQTGGQQYPLTKVTANHYVSVTFKALSETVFPSAGPNGTISPNTAQTVNYGSNITFTASANAGYTVDSWYLDGNAVQHGGRQYALANVTTNHYVSVTFKTLGLTVTPSAGLNGAINPTTTQTVTYGGSITFTATANAGYTVSIWSLDGTVAQIGGWLYALGNITTDHAVNVTFKLLGTYTITPSSGANGAITPSATQTVTSGGSVTFTAAANTGYTVDSWQLDGTTIQTGGTQYTLKSITANHAVKVIFKAFTYTLTPTAGANGTITPNSPQTVSYGGSVTFTATANTGYTVDSWQLDSAIVQTGGTQYAVKNVTASHAVKVTFKALGPYVITPTAGTNGAISPSTPQTVNFGSSVTFTAAANTGYTVDSWQLDSAIVQTGGTQYALNTVTANHTVKVTFKAQTFVMTPTAGINGTISPNTPQRVSYGGSITFTATPATGFQVANWAYDGSTLYVGGQPANGAYTGLTCTVKSIAANHAVTVSFRALGPFTVTPSSGSNGTIAPSTTQTVSYGGSVTFTATANAGYTVDVWMLDGVAAQAGGARYQLQNVTANHAVTVTFKPLGPFIITPSNGLYGTIAPSTAQTVSFGGSVTFTATANAGYTVDSWSLDGTGAQTGGTQYTLKNVTANHTVNVTFKLLGLFTVFPSAGPHGTITPNTPQTIGYGSTALLTATANAGYTVDTWYLDSVAAQSGGGQFTLRNIIANHSVSVTFKALGPYTVTPAAGVNGSITPSTPQTVAWGSSVTFTATANYGYTVSIWSLDGAAMQTGGGQFSVTNVTANHTVNVTFKQLGPYVITPSADVNGAITPSTPQTVAYGGSVLFTATANAGYTVDSWFLDSALTQLGGARYTAGAITANHAVKVTFKALPVLTIFAYAGANGVISPNTMQKVLYGSSLTFTATANAGYTVDAWSLDGTVAQTGGARYILANVIADHAVSVSFKPLTFVVTPTAGANGTINPVTAQTVSYGGSVTFTATANTGYTVDSWQLDGVTVPTGGTQYTVSNVTANHAVKVTFKHLGPFTVTPAAGANGAISPNTSQTVSYGSSITFTATANAGYTVESWALDGTAAQTGGTQYTVKNVTANHAVKVTFKQLVFTITPTAGANGAISPSTPQTVAYGGSLTFIAVANAGYTVDSWTVNGAVIQTGGVQYTLQNVTANAAVSVRFALIPQHYQPDLAIKSSADGGYTGDHIYSTDGKNETAGILDSPSSINPQGKNYTYTFYLRNDGSTADTFMLNLVDTHSSTWSVQISDPGGKDITAAIKTGITVGSLNAGEFTRPYTITIVVPTKQSGSARQLITATSSKDNTKVDVVIANTSVTYQ